jgi:hypothetical protein
MHCSKQHRYSITSSAVANSVAHREAECFGSPDVDEMPDGSGGTRIGCDAGIGHIGLICASGIRAPESTGADQGFFSQPPLRYLDESHRAVINDGVRRLASG